jgi:8-oxo-dGTP pyrophosphatase MutT (NUDIX family)
MSTFTTEYWQETESKVEFIPTNEAPSLPITAVKIYAIEDGKLLLAKVGRGWDVPGGHIEPGETPGIALVRELKEETGASAERYTLLGYLKIVNVKENERNKRYPKLSCSLVYKAEGLTFDKDYDLSQFESTDQRLVPFGEVGDYHHNWTDMKKQILEYAVRNSNGQTTSS